jgi:hypothetical protein
MAPNALLAAAHRPETILGVVLLATAIWAHVPVAAWSAVLQVLPDALTQPSLVSAAVAAASIASPACKELCAEVFRVVEASPDGQLAVDVPSFPVEPRSFVEHCQEEPLRPTDLLAIVARLPVALEVRQPAAR